MTDLAWIIAQLAAAGADLERVGNRLVLRAGQSAIPEEIVAAVREHKLAFIEALADRPTDQRTDDWEERAAIAEYDGALPRAWAERIANLASNHLKSVRPRAA